MRGVGAYSPLSGIRVDSRISIASQIPPVGGFDAVFLDAPDAQR
jgi:hypothetical protein